MRKTAFPSFLMAGLAAAMLFANQARAEAPKTAKAPPKLNVGDVAPDFTLSYFDGNDLKKISLHDYRGKKNILLGFYVFAFTGG